MANDFEERQRQAQAELEQRRSNTEEELNRLRKKRGRLKGRNAPQAQLDGIKRRIEAAEGRLEDLEDTSPIDLMEDQTEDPTPRRFQTL